jgi:hypothetical protein
MIACVHPLLHDFATALAGPTGEPSRAGATAGAAPTRDATTATAARRRFKGAAAVTLTGAAASVMLGGPYDLDRDGDGIACDW